MELQHSVACSGVVIAPQSIAYAASAAPRTAIRTGRAKRISTKLDVCHPQVKPVDGGRKRWEAVDVASWQTHRPPVGWSLRFAAVQREKWPVQEPKHARLGNIVLPLIFRVRLDESQGLDAQISTWPGEVGLFERLE